MAEAAAELPICSLCGKPVTAPSELIVVTAGEGPRFHKRCLLKRAKEHRQKNRHGG